MSDSIIARCYECRKLAQIISGKRVCRECLEKHADDPDYGDGYIEDQIEEQIEEQIDSSGCCSCKSRDSCGDSSGDSSDYLDNYLCWMGICELLQCICESVND